MAITRSIERVKRRFYFRSIAVDIELKSNSRLTGRHIRYIDSNLRRGNVMGNIVRFADSGKQCWSRVDLENGDPIFISVAQSGVLVKRSNLGFMGAKLYSESNVYKAAATAEALDSQISAYALPANLTNSILRAFTQAALEATSAADLSIRLNRL